MWTTIKATKARISRPGWKRSKLQDDISIVCCPDEAPDGNLVNLTDPVVDHCEGCATDLQSLAPSGKRAILAHCFRT